MQYRFRSICLLVLASLFAGGCSEPLTAYRAVGHNPTKAARILVLPFLDTRTFTDPNDPLRETAGIELRNLFAEQLGKNDFFAEKEVLCPELERPQRSISLEEAVRYGTEQGADLVVAGQVFSFTETRAASIPPRAGLFVRIFSVPEKRLVYLGDHYQSAGGPGARGGRAQQARLVSDKLIQGYLVTKKSGASAYEPGSILVGEGPKDGDKILVLPYHDRPNSSNLIKNTGGGAVVTSIFNIELARLGSFRLIRPSVKECLPDQLLSVEEALALGKKLGADYVLRGQVVEFRRSASVPSFYSAIISTAILAAQVLFAEMSGVDLATELWRVEDGVCIFSKRDKRRQKYVVQAERTVRRVAAVTIPELASAVNNPGEEGAKPLIDTIVIEALLPGAGQTGEETVAANPDVKTEPDLGEEVVEQVAGKAGEEVALGVADKPVDEVVAEPGAEPGEKENADKAKQDGAKPSAEDDAQESAGAKAQEDVKGDGKDEAGAAAEENQGGVAPEDEPAAEPTASPTAGGDTATETVAVDDAAEDNEKNADVREVAPDEATDESPTENEKDIPPKTTKATATEQSHTAEETTGAAKKLPAANTDTNY